MIGAAGALEEGAGVLVGGGGAVRGCATTREGLGGSACVVVDVVGSLVTGRGGGCTEVLGFRPTGGGTEGLGVAEGLGGGDGCGWCNCCG